MMMMSAAAGSGRAGGNGTGGSTPQAGLGGPQSGSGSGGTGGMSSRLLRAVVAQEPAAQEPAAIGRGRRRGRRRPGAGCDAGRAARQRAGNRFDDLTYSPELKKLIVPAGRTEPVDLVDPKTLEVTVISGFTATTMFTLGKHRSGPTSADYGAGEIFAIDNESKTVRVDDLATNMVTSMAMLAAAPDYVRWVETTHDSG